MFTPELSVYSGMPAATTPAAASLTPAGSASEMAMPEEPDGSRRGPDGVRHSRHENRAEAILNKHKTLLTEPKQREVLQHIERLLTDAELADMPEYVDHGGEAQRARRQNEEQEQHQEQEEEQEQEQEEEKVREEDVVETAVDEAGQKEWAKEEAAVEHWALSQLERSPDREASWEEKMKSQAARAAAPFYPLSDFRVFVSATSKLNPLEFPPYLALSHNFHAQKWWEKAHRRLKNVVVLMEWVPDPAAWEASSERHTNHSLTPEQHDRLHNLFRKYDAQQTGSIPAAHVRELLAAFDEQSSAAISDDAIAAIATTANGEVAFVNFEALLGAICAAVVLEVRRGHHFVALSLAEAEALRATLHVMRRRGDGKLPGCEHAAIALRIPDADRLASVELEHELSEPESSLSRPPRRRMIDVTFADAQVDVHWVAFENYYTASVTVLHTNSPPIDPQPRWTCALGQLRLMASAHCEDDAQDRHELHATAFADGFDATRVTRLRFCLAQPSPAWAEHGLRRLKFYTARVATPTAWATLRPEPSLAAEEAEHADQLARGAGQLAALARQIRAALAQAPRPRPAAALPEHAEYVLGEWADEIVDVPLHPLRSREVES